MSVVYLYQCLRTVNSKRWSKSPFSCFSLFSEDFDEKKLQKMKQKLASFGLFPHTVQHKNAVWNPSNQVTTHFQLNTHAKVLLYTLLCFNY